MATEEPEYKVVERLGSVELREYAPYVVAEVLIERQVDDASSAAFPILAGYIFGKNKGSRKIAMTAPVTQTAQPMKIAMTAPVTQTTANGGYRVQFVMPRAITLETAPEPLDSRVKLREVPARRVAAIRFSGFWSEENYQQNFATLKKALEQAKIPWSGEPTFARYDAPFVPWFVRRNEIWLTVTSVSS